MARSLVRKLFAFANGRGEKQGKLTEGKSRELTISRRFAPSIKQRQDASMLCILRDIGEEKVEPELPAYLGNRLAAGIAWLTGTGFLSGTFHKSSLFLARRLCTLAASPRALRPTLECTLRGHEPAKGRGTRRTRLSGTRAAYLPLSR
jgi:hypothetical protein